MMEWRESSEPVLNSGSSLKTSWAKSVLLHRRSVRGTCSFAATSTCFASEKNKTLSSGKTEEASAEPPLSRPSATLSPPCGERGADLVHGSDSRPYFGGVRFP